MQDKDGLCKVSNSPTWIHSDIMDDNIHLEPYVSSSGIDNNSPAASSIVHAMGNGYTTDGKLKKWRPSHILDFSDMSIGELFTDSVLVLGLPVNLFFSCYLQVTFNSLGNSSSGTA